MTPENKIKFLPMLQEAGWKRTKATLELSMVSPEKLEELGEIARKTGAVIAYTPAIGPIIIYVEAPDRKIGE